jgi:hypothetical protein
MTSLAERLRSELLPSSQLEELFFDAIVRLSTCASFLSQHIERDPEFTQTETPRRMRILLTTESKLRYSYEEFRRLKMARQLQLEDETQAARPLLAVVASHTSRSGFRVPPRPRPMPNPFDRLLDHCKLDDARVDAQLKAGYLATIETVTRPITPGRNAACPCNSGRKYKHCCANKKQAA